VQQADILPPLNPEATHPPFSRSLVGKSRFPRQYDFAQAASVHRAWGPQPTHGLVSRVFYATADEADAYMFYRCFFLFFVFVLFCFLLFPSVTKIPDNRSRERLNGFS